MATPRLTIQIVGWNSAQDLRETVKSLQRLSAEEVIIRYLDNASTDDSVHIVRTSLPHADIVQLDTNTGFAAANDIGFSKCTTEFVLVHNPDVQVEWNGIMQLLSEFDKDNELAAVQGKLYRDVNEKILDSTGILLGKALTGSERGAGEKDTGQYNTPTSLDAVTGACGLYRVSAIRSVAYSNTSPVEIYDHDFFSYREDVDVGWRLRKAGLKLRYIPVVMGVHKRTLGKRGFMNWGLNPIEIYKRLKNPRTRYSLRNYVWMLMKNLTFKDEFKHDWFIAPRLVIFLGLTLIYWPLFAVWFEIFQGAPKMISKRSVGLAEN